MRPLRAKTKTILSHAKYAEDAELPVLSTLFTLAQEYAEVHQFHGAAMRRIASPLRQPSRVASDKVCGFQRQRNLYRELFLRQSLRVLRTEGRRPKELKSILRETRFISNRRYNTLTQTAQNAELPVLSILFTLALEYAELRQFHSAPCGV